MNRILIISCLIIAFTHVRAQEYVSFNPAQMAIKTSTARVANSTYANSSFAQFYYTQNYSATMATLFPDYHLTDSRIIGNGIQISLPSYPIGAVSLAYGQYSINNLGSDIFLYNTLQVGYSNTILKRLVWGVVYKWQNFKWYSKQDESRDMQGSAIDLSAIYIIDKDFSIGMNLKNLLSPQFSSGENDREIKANRFSLLWDKRENSISLESGILMSEDYQSNSQYGGFINTEFKIAPNLYMAAEYRRLVFNELGALLGVSYQLGGFNLNIAYGFRWIDSDLPQRLLKHSLGINISIPDNRQTSIAMLNPQILLADDVPPQLAAQRLGNHTLLSRENPQEILKFIVESKDRQSGLKKLYFSVYEPETPDISLYDTTIYLSANKFSDTLYYYCRDNYGDLLANNEYLMKVLASDNADNVSNQELVTFKVLSPRNDQLKPQIEIAFDTSGVFLGKNQNKMDFFADVTITDNTQFAQWNVQLYKMFADSSWHIVKTYSGESVFKNKRFTFSLRKHRRFSLPGLYRIKVVANDEVKNFTVLLSDVRKVSKELELDIETEPKILAVYSTEKELLYKPDEQIGETDYVENENIFQVSYYFQNQKIRLSELAIRKDGSFKLEKYSQSLSVIGVYLQDMPNAGLRLELPLEGAAMNSFGNDISGFFGSVFGVDKSRIRFEYNNKLADEIIFRIIE